MQQLILLLTSFLLGCRFPAFLIGFYSIRILESRLRALSMSFVGSDSSGFGREKLGSKRRRDRDRNRRRETADKPGRETSTSLFSSSGNILTKSIFRPKSTSVDVVSPGGHTISVSVEGFHPLRYMMSAHWPKGWPIPQYRPLTQVGS
jgi:hypothetical protein